MRLEDAKASAPGRLRRMDLYPWTPDLDHLLLECYVSTPPMHTSVFEMAQEFNRQAGLRWPSQAVGRRLDALLARLIHEAEVNRRRAEMHEELARRRTELPADSGPKWTDWTKAVG